VKTPLMFLHPDELFRLAHVELTQRLLALCERSGASIAGRESPRNHKAHWNAVPETTYG
jgi:hypothetical protein